MKIRKMEKTDLIETKQLVKQSFYREGKDITFNEWEFVSKIIKDESFIDELCLVAEESNAIVGYIILTKAKIGISNGLTLGPIAVKPEYQGKRIGTKLIQTGLEVANNLNYEWVALIGGEYYLQFGFTEVKNKSIYLSEKHPENNYIKVKSIKVSSIPNGKLTFASSFYNSVGELL